MLHTRAMDNISRIGKVSNLIGTMSHDDENTAPMLMQLNKMPCQNFEQLKMLNDALDNNENLKKLMVGVIHFISVIRPFGILLRFAFPS